MPTLLLLTTVVLGLQLVNAIAIYYVAITSRAIGRSFHLRAAERILEAFSRAPYVRPGLEEARSELRASVIRYPRIMGTAIERIVDTLQAGCYVIGYLVVLLKISVEVSLFTLPVFLLVLPFFYRLSTVTQQAAKAFYGRARQEASGYARDQLQTSDQTNVHPDLYGAAQRRQYRDSAVVKHYLDNYDNLRLAQRRSVLITSLFRGFLLCLILAVLGYFSIREAYSWGQLLVYVLALWQLANQVQHMMGSLVNLNRYQPRLVGYYQIHSALEEAPTAAQAPRLEGPLAIASRGRLEGDAGRLEAKRGDRIVYLIDAELSRLEFGGVLAPLLAACKRQKAALQAASFCSGADVPPRLRLSDLVLGSEAPGADERAHLETRIAELGLAEELAALPEGSDTFLSEGIWSKMSRRLRVALRILSLAESPSDVLFVDWRLVGSVEKEFATQLLGILEDRLVFLVTRDGGTESEWAEGFVIAEDQEVVGVGDARWWAAILPYRRERVAIRRARAGLDDDSDEEDEEDM
jgi:hypothetical protein